MPHIPLEITGSETNSSQLARPTAEPLQVRKYSNRRLYLSETRQFITLNELKALIIQGYQVIVTDNKTGNDITVEVLFQVVLESACLTQWFSAQFLHQLIRCRDVSTMRQFGQVLPRLFQQYVSLQQKTQQEWVNWTLNLWKPWTEW